MTVNIALAVAIGARLLPHVNRMEWTILASAGTIGALFGTPVAAALIFSQTLNGSSEVPLWIVFCAINGGSSWCTYYRIIFPSPFFTAHCALRTDGNDRYSQRCNCRGDCHRSRDGRRMVLTTVARDDESNENPVLVLGIGGFILGILGVIGGPVSLFKGLDEMQQMVANQAFSTSDYFCLAVIKLAALVVAAASGFRGGRIFPAVFVGVALGLMLHEHVPAVPAAITVSCAILGIVLVVTRDGWLSLFMAAVVVPNTTLLPLLCIVMLPAWLLLAGKPMMMVNRPKQQPPHDNV
ncbi:ion channel protein [Escherichia coli]